MLDRRHLVLVITLVFALTACGLGRGDEALSTEVPVSEAAAKRLETKLAEAAGSQSDRISLSLTEEEVTSYLRLRVETDPIEQLQVEFEPGQIIVTGRATVGVSQDLRIIASPRVEDGVLQFDFHQATVGRVPIPEVLLSLVNTQLRQALTGDQVARVEQIEVGDGTITIVGRRA